MLRRKTLFGAFTLMVLLLIFGQGLPFDQSVVDTSYLHQTHARNQLALLISDLGSPAIVLTLSVLGSVTLFLLKKRRAASFLILCVFGASGLNEAAKQVFRHPLVQVTPAIANRHQPPLATNPRVSIPSPTLPRTVYAYPSGHAAGSLALLLACGALLNGKRRPWRALV